MSAAAQASRPNHSSRSAPGRRGHPRCLGRVLSLVRKLIDYGRQLAATVQQRAATPGFASSPDPSAPPISASSSPASPVACAGPRRWKPGSANAPQRGRDLTLPPIRLPAIRVPGAARPVAPPDVQPANPAQDPRLARLPTEEQIAEEVRRRPIGAVIVDICCDLGIAPGHLDRAFWDEINHAIMMYGGSLARFLNDLHKRLCVFFSADRSDRAEPGWPAAPPRLPAPATGPP